MITYLRVKKKDLRKHGNLVIEQLNNKPTKCLYLKPGIFTKYDPNIVADELFLNVTNKTIY